MSKIYEALLRAEMDRLTEKKNGDDPAISHSDRTLTKPSRAEERIPVGLDSDRSEDLSSESGRVEHGDGAADAVLPKLDLSLVPQVTWSPALLQLPALLDRGGSVEQFRGLRSRMHEFRELNVLKTLLVSSGLPAEGKSFVTINLAISLARYKNSRVLLIDGDMRRGTLHKLLGTRSEPGLTEYLSGKSSVVEVLQRPTAIDAQGTMPKGLASLTFIACGADADNASDLSGNGRFEKLLASVASSFDWILIDSSPVNLVADGANLARSCDGVLLVTRGGVTKFETAQRALLELKASKVLGVILNAVVKPPSAGGYYGYDSYDKISE